MQLLQQDISELPSNETAPENRHCVGKLSIAPLFHEFVEREMLPAIDFDAAAFWGGLEAIFNELTPTNRQLLQTRKKLQRAIDDWHLAHQGEPWNNGEYLKFLHKIGYLKVVGEPFQINTKNVDEEIANVAGPQLVVPLSNARFALNAANARWGSLYDALYGTDVIPTTDGLEVGMSYNPCRGQKVISYTNRFLDEAVPLATNSHSHVIEYHIDDSADRATLTMVVADGNETQLQDPRQFVGYTKDGQRRSILLKHNGLHIEMRIDPNHPIGKESAAGICDVLLESAITTIQDCEDSVAAVDAEDKVNVYRNWLGLMQGELIARFEKDGQQRIRRLSPDREYRSAAGGRIRLPGRSLMMIRNVGHLMTTDVVNDANGDEVFEGILDAVITTCCGLVDLKRKGTYTNSRAGSIYIVKPKMHGPDEVAFADKLLSRVEKLFGLEQHTIKIGVMDEERRTTVNLEECIYAVKDRLVFINTGFLDRTGDEIHTSMFAGPVMPKEEIKRATWIQAYEDWNVDVGIRCGLPGKAQIGKGMWPMPDEMKQMVDTKLSQLEAGASCAWVPSPSAATLHAMHYHQVDVMARLKEIATRTGASLRDILTPPICKAQQLDTDVIQAELDNNVQGILGYVVRWIDQGIGCSKVPDIHDIALMEDRATLRISSQHIANWLLHGVCTEEQVLDTLRRMAKIVDGQNAADSGYQNMSPDYEDNVAFRVACELVFQGIRQPNGYTEPLLHAYRKLQKRRFESR